MASTQSRRSRTAGAFDIRLVIGALIGIYGIVLICLGLFNATDAELDRADGMNVNLWAGLGMLALSILMALWAWWRPIVIPPETTTDER
ncbi:hypothetical protein [Solicola gregarius]|uniref:Uncharacterized protein n=1 Tax=Solicola gregarius TaxID=2908642 RepID=A0AA46TFM7_9ACTN|nr:hypothetical protein [Solicola gregarius]UYM04360.1 hypothetical protein L0C25_17730 [Solicola gregarius]